MRTGGADHGRNLLLGRRFIVVYRVRDNGRVIKPHYAVNRLSAGYLYRDGIYLLLDLYRRHDRGIINARCGFVRGSDTRIAGHGFGSPHQVSLYHIEGISCRCLRTTCQMMLSA